MFRKFAYQFQGPGEEGWAPPWLRDERGGPGMHGPFGPGGPGHGPFGGRSPRFFGMHRGRGPFGPGGPGRGPFGPGGPFGGRGPRFFGRGDVKFALLELLQDRSMHGYEMMKALEEKSGGFYVASPGSVYPTLQMLEDRGLVSVKEVEGKKVYSITDAGKALLAERHKDDAEFAGPPWMRWGEHGGHHPFPEMQALKSEAGELMRLFIIASRMSLQDPAQLTRLRGIIERTHKELTDMIYSGGSQPGQSSSASAEAGPAVENV